MTKLTPLNKFTQQVTLRLLIDLKAIHSAFNSPWTKPESALSLTFIRLEQTDHDKESVYKLLKARHKQVFENNNNLQHVSTPLLDWLTKSLSLSSIEVQVLLLLTLLHSNKKLKEIAESLGEMSQLEVCETIGAIIRQPAKTVAEVLSPQSTLVSNQLISVENSSYYIMRKCKPADSLICYLVDPYFNPQSLQNEYITETNQPLVTKKEFRHHFRDLDWLLGLLEAFKTAPKSGCNILLYGEPGSGKTQLSRLLAHEVGLKCYEVNFANQYGHQISGKDRLNKLNVAKFLLKQERCLVVFDELEDAIPLNSNDSAPQKRWFNNLLETNPFPVIWISNAVDQIDPAFLRRFNYCLKVKQPSIRHKKAMLSALLNESIDSRWLNKTASHSALTVADIHQATSIINSKKECSSRQKAHYFKNLLSMRPGNYEKRKPIIKKRHHGETKFNTEFSCTDIPLTEISDIVESAKEGRFLLHGVPGTGKTGFVHYLANKLECNLICKSGSDLLGMWVGENEKAIRNMFVEAKEKDAILLLDEADTFFSDRNGHSTQWQTSMVNEMLVQLERFKGVFFASTNLPNALDIAIKRRFDFTIKFDYLSPAQAFNLSLSILPEAEHKAVTQETFSHIPTLTPADFSVAVRQSRLKKQPITVDGLLDVLWQQSKMRAPQSNSIGFINR